MGTNNKIYVTKTFLPPQEEYQKMLEEVWCNNWITNRGKLVVGLEEKLKDYLGSPDLVLTNNGTVALQLAIKALNLKGEIITTPFSYVATTSSIVWEGLTPVFVDIHSDYLTIDESKIEEAITPNTSAILATHVYGNPCNVESIERIAVKYNLKVIYDAAHCFGINYKGTSIFSFGDVSICSFHATKLFHTGEGGAVFIKDKVLLERLYNHHNFGHKGNEQFHGLGINGKMSELQAAMGLSVLPYMETILEDRKRLVQEYSQGLKNLNIDFLKLRENTEWNYSYYPVVFKTEEDLIMLKNALEKENIFPRRYFYPSLNTLPYIENYKVMPVAENISKRVLCLPLYKGLLAEQQTKIIQIIKGVLS